MTSSKDPEQQARSQAKIPESAKPLEMKSTKQESNDGDVLYLKRINPPLKKSSNIPEIYAKMFGTLKNKLTMVLSSLEENDSTTSIFVLQKLVMIS